MATITDLLLLPMAKTPNYDPSNIGDTLNPLIPLPKPMGKIPPYVPVVVAAAGPSDFWGIENYNNGGGLDYYIDPTANFLGQIVTGTGGKISKAQFYLKHTQVNSIEGEIHAVLRAVTGTPPNAKWSGANLAVSNTFVMASTISQVAATMYEFTFTGGNQYTMVNGTKYALGVSYIGTPTGTPGFIRGANSYKPPSHSGNLTTSDGFDGTAQFDNFEDLVFSLYTE